MGRHTNNGKKVEPATNPMAQKASFARQKHDGYIKPCPPDSEAIYFTVMATGKTDKSYTLKITKEEIPAALHNHGKNLVIPEYYRKKYAEWFKMAYEPKSKR